MFKNIEVLASDVLRSAFKAGVIDPVIVLDPITERAMQYAVDNHNAQVHWQKDLWVDARSLRYKESVLNIRTMPNTAEWFVCELAQIAVPSGSIGYLSGITQYLYDYSTNYYPTGSEFWGLPNMQISDVDACRWLLRLEPFYGAMPPRLVMSTTTAIDLQAALPGFPYPDLPQFQDIWYPPHNPQRFNPLLIPGGYVLRYFFYSPPTTTYQWRVLGKLTASIQSALCKEAEYNTRILKC